MKLKKTLPVITLATLLGVGVFSGIRHTSFVKEAKAGTETTIYFAVRASDVGEGNSVRLNYRFGEQTWDDWGTTYMSLTSGTYFGNPIYSATFTDYWDGLSVLQIQKDAGGNITDMATPFYGGFTKADVYNGKMWINGEYAWQPHIPDIDCKYSTDGENYQSMTRHNSVEYTANITAPAGTKLFFKKGGNAYPTVGKNDTNNNNVTTDLFVRSDMNNQGIYLDISGENGKLWANGFVEKTSYIYYVDNYINKIYAEGGEKQFGAEGTLITAVEGCEEITAPVLRYRGSADTKVYRIPIKNTDTHFQFISNTDPNVKGDPKPIVFGRAYFWAGLEGDADAGSAIDLLDKVEDARNAVEDYGTQKQDWSICGISSGTAKALWNEYAGLNETAKGYVDASTTCTWKDATSADLANQQYWTFDLIMLQLKAIAIKGGETGLLSLGNELTIKNSNTVNYVPVIIVVSSIAVVTLLGAGLMIKRRKENQ